MVLISVDYFESSRRMHMYSKIFMTSHRIYNETIIYSHLRSTINNPAYSILTTTLKQSLQFKKKKTFFNAHQTLTHSS